MSPPDSAFLKEFFGNLKEESLDSGDPRYFPLYENSKLFKDDPVTLLQRRIDWSTGSSVQLLTGFRGTGKTTELLRLRKRLRTDHYTTLLIDMEDYIGLNSPIEVIDFLLAIACAFGDALYSGDWFDQQDPNLGEGVWLTADPAKEGYAARFLNYLTRTKVEISEVTAAVECDGAKVGLKATLRSDPSFKQKLQQRMAGHQATFIADVKRYIKDCVNALRQQHDDSGRQVVLLVDSVEHIRGTTTNVKDVHASVENLFMQFNDALELPELHVVYTVPPFLKALCPGLGSRYSPGGMQLLPSVNVSKKAGLDVLEQVVRKRGDWEKLLGKRARLNELLKLSGGHLRDLFRLLREVVIRADSLPVDRDAINGAIDQIRNEFLPIADDDVAWLNRITTTKTSGLEEGAALPRLAHFLDTHLVLCYRNGHEWYDIHPLIQDFVSDQVKRIAQKSAKPAPDSGQTDRAEPDDD